MENQTQQSSTESLDRMTEVNPNERKPFWGCLFWGILALLFSAGLWYGFIKLIKWVIELEQKGVL